MMNRWYQGRDDDDDDDDDDASECVNGSHSETIVFFFYRAHSEESHEARCNSQHGSPWLGVPVQLLLVISLLYSLYILRLWVVGCIPGPHSKARIHIFTRNFQYSLKIRKISKNIDPVNPVHVIPVHMAHGPSVSAPASSAQKQRHNDSPGC